MVLRFSGQLQAVILLDCLVVAVECLLHVPEVSDHPAEQLLLRLQTIAQALLDFSYRLDEHRTATDDSFVMELEQT